MTKLIFFILCVLTALPSLAAAADRLTGTVTDADSGEPLAGAIVKAGAAFTTTDGDGAFGIVPGAGADSVTFRCMGYEPLTLPLTAGVSAVRLRPRATVLNDVIVEAPDIYARGDTLVFNVARYATEKDNAIIDVIKRLPGIKVKEDGTIEYQGKPISKFYLDGNDFIGGQYGLATDNISHKDVKSVEVLENHQPVKALEGLEFPDRAAINLKLREGARNRWMGVANAGTGFKPLLYNASAFAMRMSPGVQNLFTLKADNTGWNPANEIREHDFDSMFGSGYAERLWPEYISADMVSAPLSEKRTRDNLSWLADAITAWKSGDTSMRLKLDYMGDRLDYSSGMTTDYFDPDIPRFVRTDRQRTRSHALSAQFYTETNKRGFYLKDKFTLDGELKKSDAEVTGSFSLDQLVRRRRLSATNDLKLVKRNEERLFTLVSRNRFDRSPDRLSVSGDEEAVQKVGISALRSTTEVQAGRLTRFWKYYLTAGLDLDWHRMNASLAGLGDYDNAGTHNAMLSSVYATPQADYIRNGWRLSLRLPVEWKHQSVRGQHDFLGLSPSMTARRQLTAKSELTGAVAWRLEAPRPYLNLDVPILADYRNIFIGAAPGHYSQTAGTSISYRYRNPLKALFGNLSAGFNHSRGTTMSNQLFEGDFVITTYGHRFSTATTWSVSGAASKGFAHSRMVAGIEAGADLTSASSMRDNATIPYRQTAVTVKPYFKGTLLNWLSANYEAQYRYTRLNINNTPGNTHTLRHSLFATVTPHDRVYLTLGAEHYLTSLPAADATTGTASGRSGNTCANLLLLDASAAWRISNRLQLMLIANNLLDKRRYEYVTYGTLSRSAHTFRIRPRTLLATFQLRF